MAKTCSINNPCSKKMENTVQRTIHGEPLEADLNRWNYRQSQEPIKFDELLAKPTDLLAL